MSLVFWLIVSFRAFAEPALPWLPYELQCPAGTRFRYSYQGRHQEEPAALCFNRTRSVLLAERCRRGACEALASAICKLEISPSPVGSEGGKLCLARGGYLQEGEFYDGAKWWDMDRCLFPGDQSFVDTGVLAARRAACPQ